MSLLSNTQFFQTYRDSVQVAVGAVVNLQIAILTAADQRPTLNGVLAKRKGWPKNPDGFGLCEAHIRAIFG